MKSKIFLIPVISILLAGFSTAVQAKSFGHRLCQQESYHCLKINRGDSWDKLFPDKKQQDIVRHVNRINIGLQRGMIIAVPKNLAHIDKMDVAPFPDTIPPPGNKTIILDQEKLAWGAYDADGQLVNWAPASAGKNYCPDLGRRCTTVKGNFTFYSKRGQDCKSSKYPVGRGGAEMPYCMFFHGGYAIHGSYTVPGFNASHGCIRTFVDEARWLNQEFIEVGSTKVIIK